MRFFKEVPDYPNYIVSIWGLIYSKPRKSYMERTGAKPCHRKTGGKFLKPVDQGKRLQHVLSNGELKTTFNLGSIVLKSFVGPRPEGMQCCHNNGNYKDNRLENLRWDTGLSNQRDKFKHGTSNRGTNSGKCKLYESEVLEIRSSTLDARILARKYGVTRGTIYCIRSKRSWSWL